MKFWLWMIGGLAICAIALILAFGAIPDAAGQSLPLPSPAFAPAPGSGGVGPFAPAPLAQSFHPGLDIMIFLEKLCFAAFAFVVLLCMWAVAVKLRGLIAPNQDCADGAAGRLDASLLDENEDARLTDGEAHFAAAVQWTTTVRLCVMLTLAVIMAVAL